jgi:ketosteroid isomerase-like protein
VHDGDLDAIAADYAPDALVLTPTGQYRGAEQVRGLYAELSQALPRVALEATEAVFADDVLLLHWTADSALHAVPDGIDTFIFRDGKIQVQTISCTLVPKG